MSTKGRALVVSLEDFGEADRYVRFYTKDWGLISALAKSARKSKRRYVGGLDLFCHNEITLRGDPREKPYLVELTVLNSFQLIRENLDKMLLAGKITAWVKKLADTATPMPGIYSLLGQSLSLIESEPNVERLELLGLIFKLKLLSQLGLKPRFDACARCESLDDIEGIFDLSAGGILCRVCSPKANALETSMLSPEHRKFLRVADEIRLTQWEQIRFSSEPLPFLSRVVTQFASFHTHVRLPL